MGALQEMLEADGAKRLEINYEDGECYAVATINHQLDEIAIYEFDDLPAEVKAEADALPNVPPTGDEVVTWPQD